MLARPEYGTRLHILTWLAQQPPRAKFNWDDCTTCAVARYADAHGMKNPFIGDAREFPLDLARVNSVGQRLTMMTGRGSVAFGKLLAALEKEWGLCVST